MFDCIWMAAASAVAVAAAYSSKQAQKIPEPADGYVLTSDGTNMTWEPMPNPVVTSGKCPCCGSRQFVPHRGMRICAYCRSAQDGQAIRADDSERIAFAQAMSEQNADAYREILYGMGVLRPETAVRITKSPA